MSCSDLNSTVLSLLASESENVSIGESEENGVFPTVNQRLGENLRCVHAMFLTQASCGILKHYRIDSLT